VLALVAVSGIADVDAITLSLADMTAQTDGAVLDAKIAVTGIIIAAASNCLVKAGMATAIGDPRLDWPVALPLVAAAVLGPAAARLTLW
jgi:uncharacterized membrane protein (DUF4010 family)